MKPLPKLSDAILLGLATYYFNRQRGYNHLIREGLKQLSFPLGFRLNDDSASQMPPSTKDADLRRLDEIVANDGKWQWSASAGTFWFQRKHRRKNLTITCNANNYLDGGSAELS